MLVIPESRIIRRLIRKSNILVSRTSYPFLSGNTFKSLCDAELDNNFDAFFNTLSCHNKLFIDVNNLHLLVCWLKSHPSALPRRETLIVHNGDLLPEPSDCLLVKSYFSRLHAVNWLGSSNDIQPLPIGLENISLVQNGVPRDFARTISKHKNSWQKRSIEILIAFNDQTQVSERTEARNASKHIKGAFVTSGVISPRKYRELVANSKYVLSPPGNGPDCHRTWEALYLGSVPIVKKDYWNFQDLNNHVVVLDSWTEIINYRGMPQRPLADPIEQLSDMFLGEF